MHAHHRPTRRWHRSPGILIVPRAALIYVVWSYWGTAVELAWSCEDPKLCIWA